VRRGPGYLLQGAWRGTQGLLPGGNKPGPLWRQQHTKGEKRFLVCDDARIDVSLLSLEPRVGLGGVLPAGDGRNLPLPLGLHPPFNAGGEPHRAARRGLVAQMGLGAALEYWVGGMG